MSKHLHSRAARTVATLAAAAALLTTCRAQTATSSPTAAPGAPSSATAAASTPAAKPTPEQEKAFLEAYGWFVGIQGLGVKELGLTPAEVDEIATGIKLAITTSKPPGGETVLQGMKEYLTSRAEANSKAQAAKEEEAAKTFFANLDKNPNIKKTASGLYYEIVAPGTGDKPKPSNDVVAKYKGAFISGEVFDETKGDETRTFGLDEVIPGWTEGLQLIGKGGKIKLYVPGKLGYGPEGRAPVIPPNATLVFDVEVVDIKDAPKPPAGGAPLNIMDLLQQQQGGAPGGAGAPKTP